MAPDINSMPSSPRQDRGQLSSQTASSNSASRRTSREMPPPPIPLPPSSHQPPVPSSPVLSSNEYPGEPLRHPRPLTAAELYAECEKEQEAVVNRLTRELTALRAQSASVASNASQSSTSTSASLLPVDISDPNPTHQLTGATHPTPSRRHRSSSSLSTRSTSNTPSTSASASASASGITNVSTQTQAGSSTSVPHGSVSQASADRAAAVGHPSRQSSISASASGTSTPAQQPYDTPRHGQLPTGASHTLPHRPSLSREPSNVSQSPASSTVAHQGTPAPLSPTQSITTPHYIDTAAYRSELENVKAENEALRQRVRALERALRARRRDSSNSDAARPNRERDNSVTSTSPSVTSPEARSAFSPAGVAAWAADGGIGGVAPPRERSESQSTTTSSRRGLPGEDDVRLGESAGSVGIGRGV